MSIKLEAVSYSGHGCAAIRELDLELSPGEFVGIMGRPGCGKTALLHLAAGLLHPESGSVYIKGRNLASKIKKGEKTPELPAILTRSSRNQFFEQNLERELLLSLKTSGLSGEERHARARLWLEKVGFDSSRNPCSPLSLSEGERQLLAIAAVLVREPDILILDDPFAALGGLEREKVMELLKEQNMKGTTVLMSTGESQLISSYAKRVIVMDNGRIVRDDSAKSVFSDYYELCRRKLPVPKVREAAQRLREREINMPANIVLYEQFIDRLKIIMWRKER